MQPQKDFKRSLIAILLSISLACSGALASPQMAYASSKVYVAPYSGTKYHCTRSCRGLRNARSVERISKRSAQAQGYTKCRICYR